MTTVLENGIYCNLYKMAISYSKHRYNDYCIGWLTHSLDQDGMPLLLDTVSLNQFSIIIYISAVLLCTYLVHLLHIMFITNMAMPFFNVTTISSHFQDTKLCIIILIILWIECTTNRAFFVIITSCVLVFHLSSFVIPHEWAAWIVGDFFVLTHDVVPFQGSTSVAISLCVFTKL